MVCRRHIRIWVGGWVPVFHDCDDYYVWLTNSQTIKCPRRDAPLVPLVAAVAVAFVEAKVEHLRPESTVPLASSLM